MPTIPNTEPTAQYTASSGLEWVDNAEMQCWVASYTYPRRYRETTEDRYKEKSSERKW